MQVHCYETLHMRRVSTTHSTYIHTYIQLYTIACMHICIYEYLLAVCMFMLGLCCWVCLKRGGVRVLVSSLLGRALMLHGSWLTADASSSLKCTFSFSLLLPLLLCLCLCFHVVYYFMWRSKCRVMAACFVVIYALSGITAALP